MKLLTNLLDKLFEASWNRSRMRKREGLSIAQPIETEDVRVTSPTRTFTIKQALNGQFIEFTRHRWNPKGPDDFERCIYIVQDGQTVVDAVAVVLVLMDKPMEE